MNEEHLSNLPTHDWRLIHQLIERFEDAWESGEIPKIESYLPNDERLHPAALEALIRIDVERRTKARVSLGVEKYAESFPEIVGTPLLLDLIVIDARTRTGEAEGFDVEHYVECFPHLEAPIRSRFRAGHTDDQETRVWPGAHGDTSQSGSSKERSKPNLPTIPGYEIDSVVASGGMGTVFQARDQRLGRPVAIKLPRPHIADDAEGRERFLREARAAAKLRHPNICPIYEIGDVEGQPYIAMAFISGPSLKQIARDNHLSGREAAELVGKLAKAVDYAHQHDVVHRDIKPANVLLEEKTREPILTDFGLAKELTEEDSRVTQTGQIMGTPAYMAPEQARGDVASISPRTDVYALGALLFHLLCGRPPFEGSVNEILVSLQSTEPPRPRSLTPELHRDLETICLQALAKRPEDRYATANELAADLGRFTSSEAIHARPEGVLRRTLRAAGRRKGVLAAIGAASLVASMALIFVVSAWQRDVRDATASARIRQSQADAKLAHDLWKQGDPDRLYETVKFGMAPAGEKPNFVDRYLTSLTTQADRTIIAHRSSIQTLAVARNGNLVATADSSKQLKLFNANDWNVIASRQFDSDVQAVRFSADGKRVSVALKNHRIWLAKSNFTDWQEAPAVDDAAFVRFSSNLDKVVIVRGSERKWRIAIRKMLGSQPESTIEAGDMSRIEWIGLSPDDNRLAFARYRGIYAWDLSTQKRMTTTSNIPYPHAGDFISETSVFFAGEQGSMGVWDLERVRPRWQQQPADGVAKLVAVSPEQSTAAVLSQNGRIDLIDLRQGRLLGRYLSSPTQITAIAFTATGEQLLTGSEDGRLQVWSARPPGDYQPLDDFVETSGVAVYSPTDDAVAIATPANTIVIGTGPNRQTAAVCVGHTDVIQELEYCGHQLIVSVSADKTTRLWNAQTSEQLAEFLDTDKSPTCVAGASTGRLFATGGTDRNVRIYDAVERKLLAELPLHTAAVNDLAFSPNGDLLASVGADGQCVVWDTKQEERATSFFSDQSAFRHVRFANDEQLLLVDGDGRLTLRPIKEGQAKTLDLNCLEAPSIAIASNGSIAVCRRQFAGRSELTVYSSALEVTEMLRSDTTGADSVAFSPDGTRLLAASKDGTVREWNLKKLSVQKPSQQRPSKVVELKFTPDGKHLVSLSRSKFSPTRYKSWFNSTNDTEATGIHANELAVWDVASGRLVSYLNAIKDGGRTFSIAPDSSTVAVGGRDGMVWIGGLLNGDQKSVFPLSQEAATANKHRPPTGRLTVPVMPKFHFQVVRVAFSPNGERLAVIDQKQQLQLWDVRDGKAQLLREWSTTPLLHLAFAPDGSALYATKQSSVLRFDLDQMQDPAAEYLAESEIQSMSVSSQGSFLAIGLAAGRVVIWPKDGSADPIELAGHDGSVNAIAFSPQEDLVVTAGEDATVRIWSLTTRIELLKLEGHDSAISCIAFSPDGSTLASAGEDKHGRAQLRLWRSN